MRQINILGFKVAGVTALILLVLLGLYWGGKFLFTDKEESAGQTASLTGKTGDTDGDGIADLYETNFYNTDPNKADSDSDGTSDLDEITVGRDPLIPGPNDLSRPATGSNIGQAGTYTQRYLASLPGNSPREEILNQARLEAFVSANKGILLPAVSVTSTDTAGAEAVSAYLNTISSSHNSQIKTITSADIEAAFRLQVNSQDSKPLNDLSTMLKNNLAVLQQVRPPQEATALHTKLVAASIALSENTGLLLQMDQDFVGGLIGARKIEELGTIFQELATSVKALEDKYGLK